VLDIFANLVGAAAAFFIGYWLATRPRYEPRAYIRYPEIAVSWFAAAWLFYRAVQMVW